MDGVLDFRLCELIRQFIAYRSIGGEEFDLQLRRHLQFFQDGLINPSFFDNHDMNRLIYITGNDARKVRLAALLQFTLPAPPIIYYGDEAGLSQVRLAGKLEEARRPFPWNDIDSQMLLFYKQLIAARKRWQKTLHGPAETILTEPSAGLYVCRRGEVVLAVNNSDVPRTLSSGILNSCKLEVASEAQVSISSHILNLPACSGAWLTDANRASPDR